MKRCVLHCSIVALIFFTVGCSENDEKPAQTSYTDHVEISASPLASTLNAAQTIPPSPELLEPTIIPYSEDKEHQEIIENFPDYWGDWIPDDESVYIIGVKDFGFVTYHIQRSPDQMKEFFNQQFDDSEWGDGEWSEYDRGYTYILSKHNPRMKLDITISSYDDTSSNVTVFQEYRETDGY